MFVCTYCSKPAQIILENDSLHFKHNDPTTTCGVVPQNTSLIQLSVINSGVYNVRQTDEIVFDNNVNDI